MRRLLAPLSLVLLLLALPASVAGQSADARPPDAGTRDATDVTSYSATLVGLVAPNGAATRAYFEYGVTTQLGSTTTAQEVGSTGVQQVTAPLGGLTPGVRVFYRVVAVSDAGVARGAIRSFLPPRDLHGLTLAARPEPATFGATATAAGRLQGRGLANSQVILQVLVNGAWRQLGQTVRASADGTFSFPLEGLVVPLRLRAVPLDAPNLSSPVRDLRLRPRVGLSAKRGGRGRRVFHGTVRPALAGTRVSLQRRRPGGQWHVVARRPTTQGRKTRRFSITAPARPGAYRVVAVSRASMWARGVSRERAVGGRAR